MTESLPPTAAVRVGRASFDPSNFAEFEALIRKRAEYLVLGPGSPPDLISPAR
ncbi:hypothetical protein ACWEP5_06180 [Nocardia niigatensis]